MSYKVVRDFLPTCAWGKLLRCVFTWVCRILQWQSRDTVIWPQWNLWDRAGWQGHCFQTSDEEVKQVRSGKKSVKSWHTHTAFHTEREEASKNIKHSQECSYSFSFCLYVAYFYFIFSIRLVSNIIHKLGQKYVSSSYAQLLFGNVSYHKVFFLLFCAFISIPAVLPPRSLEIYHSNYWDIYYALNDTPAN